MRMKTKKRTKARKAAIIKMPEEQRTSAWKSFWNRYCNL